MNIDNTKNILVSPYDGEKLDIHINELKGDKVVDGYLFDKSQNKFFIKNSIVSFLDNSREKFPIWEDYYNNNAKTYDNYNHLTFTIQGQNETEIRTSVVNQLSLNSDSKVLEIGSGTGRDSEIIASLLGEKGELFMLDISFEMMKRSIPKLKTTKCLIEFVLASSTDLPFPDNYFDACYSFVTLAAIPNKKRAIAEMARVTKIKGKIVIGNEGVIPSLKSSEFGQMIINNCDIYNSPPPLDILPNNISNLNLRWILNGIIHIIEFTIQDPIELRSYLEYQIPGKRGGSLKTRYYGRLEGVTKEVKELITEVVNNSKLSKYEWLNKAIIEFALKQIEDEV